MVKYQIDSLFSPSCPAIPQAATLSGMFGSTGTVIVQVAVTSSILAVITAVPAFDPTVSAPLLVTLTISSLELDQSTALFVALLGSIVAVRFPVLKMDSVSSVSFKEIAVAYT